jgi:hypothetical protein
MDSLLLWKTIWVIALSLFLSYILNRYMLKTMGGRIIYTLAPVLEEALKTLPSLYWNVPLFLVHFLFGIGEAVYDLTHSSSRYQGMAAFLSVFSHSLFGGLTYLVLRLGGPPMGALLAAILVHGLWNFRMVARFAPSDGSK